MKNFYLWTIGCQQNEYEGKRLKYALEKIGFAQSNEKTADIIIIVACAVRQTAVDRILGKLDSWKGKQVLITGCVINDDVKRLSLKGVMTCQDTDYKRLGNELEIKDLKLFSSYLDQGKSQSAYVPIIFGCNNFCSYCAVPYTRGREQSRPFKEIVKEVKLLVKSGSKEIMLLGQNVNSYKYDFAKLLKTLNDLDGDFMIAFISNHPKDMSDEIINSVARLPKIKKEIHLPLQSGSDKILKAMNRPYSVSKYLKIINKIRKANPEINITTDVIVGYPGETEADFQKTVEIFKKIKYSLAYVNKYSPRKGTAAYILGDPITWKEKQRRWRELDKIANKK
jgi:tRNA-2-methylthio-N6-dimethylallyladenosine synthase